MYIQNILADPVGNKCYTCLPFWKTLTNFSYRHMVQWTRVWLTAFKKEGRFDSKIWYIFDSFLSTHVVTMSLLFVIKPIEINAFYFDLGRNHSLRKFFPPSICNSSLFKLKFFEIQNDFLLFYVSLKVRLFFLFCLVRWL